MDKYLANIGLYRKMIAQDASCLFRAVSEKIYYCQNYHQRIRKECVNFIKENRCSFEPFVQGSFEKYLERLEDPQKTSGQVEIRALSLLYRRCFFIYMFPGKVTIKIAEEDDLPEILLCCSNNSHYDIVYPNNYPVAAAACQGLLYELLYTRVLGVEVEDLQMALEVFKGQPERYRYGKSQFKCSEVAGYYTPVASLQREERESSGHSHSEDRTKAGAEDKATGGSRQLCLPYRVLKTLEPTMYRNVEFDLWLESRKELSSSNLIVRQKTDYMFAGRQYCLGDKCQVCLDRKYYNAFIQEVGTQTTGVTVFVEELGEKHLVPLTSLKPLNPVPAWNITPNKRGNFYKHPEQYPREIDPVLPGRRRYFKKPRDDEMLMARSFSRPQPELPPRLKPKPGSIQPVRSPGVHGPAPPPAGLAHEHYRPHHPFRPPSGCAPPRSQQQMYSLNKERLSCVLDPGEETQDIEGRITYETDLVVMSPGLSSSEPINSAPAAVFTSNSSSSSNGSSQTPLDPLQPNNSPVLTPGPPPPQNVLGRPDPWFVSELGEPVATALPRPYSYDPNGSDLPRDCNVLQYYYNLGVHWDRLSYLDYVVQMQQVAEAQFQPYPSTVPTAEDMVPQAYLDPVCMCPHPQGGEDSNGTPLAMKSPTAVDLGAVSYPLVQEQCGQQLLHAPYDPYMPVFSTTYHNLSPWTPGAGPHPCIHNGTYCPSFSQPPVHYITTPTHPTNLPHSQFF